MENYFKFNQKFLRMSKITKMYLFLITLLLSTTVVFAQNYSTSELDTDYIQEQQKLQAEHGPTVVVPPSREVTATGDDCTDPIVLNAASLPFSYSDLGQYTCGRGNNYSNTDLGSYDGGEDIIYELVISSTASVSIDMDPSGTTWTGLGLFSGCPGYNAISTVTGSSGSTVKNISVFLDPGTYYIMVDTWPSPNCIPSFDLTVTAEELPPPISTFPYLETFTSSTPQYWNNSSSDSWKFGTSCSYGADYDHTTGSGYFAWVDDSSPYSNPSDLETWMFDLTSITSPTSVPILEFWYWIGDPSYSSYGVSTLEIDVYDGTMWHNAVATFGYVTEWTKAQVDLTAYSSTSTKIRFRGIENTSSFRCDISLDDVGIRGLSVGDIDGYVYTTGGTPIQGATVQIEGVTGTSTDATGYYLLEDLEMGDYDVWCTADGYSPEMANVEIVVGSTVQQDFYLGTPNLTISPLLLENTLNPGEWFTDYIGMLNTGDGISAFNAAINYVSGSGWLSLSDNSGVILEGGGSFNLGVNFDAAGMTPGTVVEAEIVFNFVPTSQVIIPVTMTVAGDPLPAIENFKATLANEVTGQTALTWDFNADVTFQYFEVRRDGSVLGITTNLQYFDMLPDYGVYTYSVAAVFDEGKSTAQFDDVEWFIPESCWTPIAPEEDVMVNQTEDTWMTFENCGQGTLSWGIPFAGNFQVALYDSYGDGWNGGMLDVYVNGDMVLSGLTIPSGYGPLYWSFPVIDGDEISTVYTPGSWTGENSYEIINDQGAVVYSSPNASIPPGVLYADVSSLGFITSIIPQTGTLEEGETIDVRFTYDATGYAVGTHTQDIHLMTNEQAPDNDNIITHTMNVYVPGMIAGDVTDCNSGVGLPHVTVMANNGTNIFYGETDDYGSYELYLDAGTYDVSFIMLGYQTTIESGVVVTTGNTTTVDATMCEMAYPVSGVYADPNEADTECLITWNLPAGPYTIIYDDNSAEDFVAWNNPGGVVAVKFTPAGYPARVIGGKLFVGDGMFPEGGMWLGTEMAVGVMDDDGLNGMPGTILDSVVVSVNNFGWIEFPGVFNSVFMEGNFYVVMWQLGTSPNVAPVGVDTDLPTVYRSYAKQVGGDWSMSPYQDFMIRADVSGPTNSVTMMSNSEEFVVTPKVSGDMSDIFISTGPAKGGSGYVGSGKIVSEASATRDLNKYNVYRMFGFDPDAGQGPADGTPTSIGSSTTLSKNDTQFGSQPAGFYAYAVEAQYDNGDKSAWAYSNIVGHLIDNVVTVTSTQCDGGEPSDVEVTLVGHNYPYQVLFGISGADGVVTFDSVIDGVYDINISKVAYQNLFFANVPIYNDYNLDVVLQENNYPARNLYVDPLTSVATWDEALIEQLPIEDFEESTFPPAGWTTFSLDPGDGAVWQRINGYTGAWPIPPQFEDGTSSWFAAQLDDAESVHDGSMDLLITPMLDLRESETFALYFDSFYNGQWGGSASVEYTTDGGATWDLLQAMTPVTDWTHYEIDLGPLSGVPAGNREIWFSFHYNDNGLYADGWAVDNVSVSNGPSPILGYYVYLDDGFAGQTPPEVRTFTYPDLVYGTEYTGSVRALYACGLSDAIYYTWTSIYLYPPRELGDEYVYNTNEVPLMWYPPSADAMMMAPAYGITENDVTYGIVSDENAISRRSANDVLNSTTANGDRVVGDVLFQFDAANLTMAWGVGFDGTYVYVTDPNADATHIYQYLPDGTFTGLTFEISVGQSWIGDMASDGTNLYCLMVGGPNNIQVLDIASGTVVNTIGAGPWTGISQRGLAYDEANDEFYIGGWNDNIIYHTDGTGAVIDQFGFAGISGLEWHPQGGPNAEGSLWVQVNASPNFVTELDPANGYATIQNFLTPGGADYSGAGLALNSDGNLWVPAMTGVTVYLIDTEEPLSGGGNATDGLIGFNVYRDADYLAYVPYEGQAPDEYVYYVDNPVDPGTYLYDVSAIYDLSVFGFVGETGESMWEGSDTVTVVWGNDLPFFEGWDQGNFDFQGWRSTGDNWSVNSQVGDDAPSAEFSWDPLQELDYSVALETAPLKGDMLTEGSIFVDFDLMLNDRNSTGDEMLQVEVRNADGDWSVIETFANNGSFDWEFHHIDITNVAMGNVFQVRFNAIGQNSFDVISWYVDNVHVYRECAAPQDLTGEYVWNATDDLGAEVCWNAPDIPLPISEWIFWDSLENFSGIGLDAAGPWSAAIRWDAGMLSDYDGTYITKVRFFAQDDGFNSFTIKIWTGANAGTLVAEQLATNVLVGDWTIVDLDTPVMLDASQELWVGYTVDQSVAGVFPSGTDAGPAIAGYGDKVSLDGSAWDNLSDFGLDYNWNLGAFLEEMTTAQPAVTPIIETPYHSEGTLVRGEMKDTPVEFTDNSDRDFTGFNIYRMEEGSGSYELYDQVAYVEGQLSYCYFDAVPAVDIQKGYFYQVTATWASATDACESAPGLKLASTDDYVYVFVTGIDNPDAMLTNLYPNPATDNVTVSSSQEMTRLTVINYVGQVVYESEVNNMTSVTLNTSSYENGVYIVKVETSNGVVTKRVVISK
jgi:hypothetical protein